MKICIAACATSSLLQMTEVCMFNCITSAITHWCHRLECMHFENAKHPAKNTI